MADTFVSTNYNGNLNEFVYKVMGLGAETAEKGGYHLIPDVAYKEEIDRLETTENPFTDYTDDTPTTGATATTLKKRDLTPSKFTVWGQITPSVWLSIWKKWRAVGTLTQLNANPSFLAEVFSLEKNAATRQLDLLFWQGDTTAGAASPLRFFDGIEKLIDADSDSDVQAVSNLGLITSANIYNILEACHAKIPKYLRKDPNFKFKMNYNTWDIAQNAELDVKKTTVGVLDQGERMKYRGIEIEPYSNMSDNRIIGVTTSNAESSNFVLGMLASFDSEISGMKVEKKDLSNTTRYRFDGMAGVQYRYGGHIVSYLGS